MDHIQGPIRVAAVGSAIHHPPIRNEAPGRKSDEIHPQRIQFCTESSQERQGDTVKILDSLHAHCIPHHTESPCYFKPPKVRTREQGLKSRACTSGNSPPHVVLDRWQHRQPETAGRLMRSAECVDQLARCGISSCTQASCVAVRNLD